MHSDVGAPSRSAITVRYRYGWGLLAGGLVVCGFVGLFVYYLVTPEQATNGYNPTVAWVFLIIFAPFALIMLGAGLFMLSRGHRVHVDERGLWLHAGSDSDFVAWNELRAVHAREPQPKVKDDPNSKPVSAALVLQPVDRGFGARHAALFDFTDPSQPLLELPGSTTVRRLTRAVAKFRPDLVAR